MSDTIKKTKLTTITKPVKFICAKPNRSGTTKRVNTDGTMSDVRFANTFSIPAVCQILDPRTDYLTPTYIRLMAGEGTVYADEQIEDFKVNDYVNGIYRLEKIHFFQGTLVVHPNEAMLYNYLLLFSGNRDNAVRNRYKKKTYFEYNPDKVAQKHLEHEMQQYQIRKDVFEMPTEKMDAIARVLGVVSSSAMIETLGASHIKRDLLATALRDETGFYAALKDEYLNVKFDMYSALDQNILMWDTQDPTVLRFSNGNQIVKTSLGSDKMTYAARYLAENSPETLNQIRRLLGKGVIEDAPIDLVGAPSENSEYSDALLNGTTADIIAAMIKFSDSKSGNEKLIYFDGAYPKWGNVLLKKEGSKLKGRPLIHECLLGDDFLFDQMRQDFSKRIMKN